MEQEVRLYWHRRCQNPGAKFRLDLAARPAGDVWRVDYDESGDRVLGISRLRSQNPATALLEATGGNGYLW